MKITTSGKRKRAVAKAVVEEGNGKIFFNKKDYKTLQIFDKLKLEEPIRIYENVVGKINFNAVLKVIGGGEKGQIDAARLALAKALVKFSNSEQLTKAFSDYDRSLLVADVRRKETYKPGDSRARAARQSSKR